RRGGADRPVPPGPVREGDHRGAHRAVPRGAGGRMAVQGGLTLPTAREVIAAERALIQQRRGKRTGPLVGLALSGGGIRSATFNLGLLQALARHDLLERCDYLSTVSGGGYIGACLASLTATAGDVAQRNFPLAVSTEADRPEVKWVRAHSEYLAPRHGPFNVDTWRLISAYLGGLVFTLTTAAAILAVLAAAVIIIYPQIV